MKYIDNKKDNIYFILPCKTLQNTIQVFSSLIKYANIVLASEGK
ncbi:MAG: hypothetical protein IRD7MM_04535 [Candidatus Midichloria mitochondrii]